MEDTRAQEDDFLDCRGSRRQDKWGAAPQHRVHEAGASNGRRHSGILGCSPVIRKLTRMTGNLESCRPHRGPCAFSASKIQQLTHSDCRVIAHSVIKSPDSTCSSCQGLDPHVFPHSAAGGPRAAQHQCLGCFSAGCDGSTGEWGPGGGPSPPSVCKQSCVSVHRVGPGQPGLS